MHHPFTFLTGKVTPNSSSAVSFHLNSIVSWVKNIAQVKNIAMSTEVKVTPLKQFEVSPILPSFPQQLLSSRWFSGPTYLTMALGSFHLFSSLWDHFPHTGCLTSSLVFQLNVLCWGANSAWVCRETSIQTSTSILIYPEGQGGAEGLHSPLTNGSVCCLARW